MELVDVLVALAFGIFALAVGDGQCSKKQKVMIDKWRHNAWHLVLIMMVGMICFMRIFVMGCSCHGTIQVMTQLVCARPE
jgi:branched-subunit amino acid permease